MGSSFSRKCFFVILCFFMAVESFCLPFNLNVTKEELDDCITGQTLIRNISTYKRICLETDIAEVNEYLAAIEKLDPKYLVEVVHLASIREYPDLLSAARRLFCDFDAYPSIPYWSEKGQRYFPLYTYSKVVSDVTLGDTRYFKTDLEMPPFKVFSSDIDITTRNNNFFLYKSINTTDVEAMAFIKVNERNLRSVITIFQDGDYWVIYGIGAAKAPKLSFITRRMEVAFIGRVKAFCDYALTLLNK